MSLPPSLEWIRKYIHRFRMLMHKALGIHVTHLNASSGTSIPAEAVMSRMLTLSDRLSTLESNVNWRLYGLPPRVCNIKLEQARLLAGSGDVEAAIQRLQSHEIFATDALRPLFPTAPCAYAVAFGGQDLKEAELVKASLNPKKLTVLRDTSDLFHSNALPASLQEAQILTLESSSAAGVFFDPEFDYVWLSSVVERLSPLQFLVLLVRLERGLQVNGKAQGYFVDFAASDPGTYWTDPRRLRPITRAYIEEMARIANIGRPVFTALTPTTVGFTLQK